MTTSVGPHAGDDQILPEHRLQIPLVDIAHVHAGFMYLFLGLTVGLIAAIFTLKTSREMRKTALFVVGAILLQALIGLIQYWTGVPRWTVPVHVIGSGLTTLVMGLLWAQRLRRVGGSAAHTGSVAADAEVTERYNYV